MKNNTNFNIFLLTLFFFIKSGYSCEDLRLDLDPQVLGNVPPGNQGKTSNCFGEVASQLVDAFRFSHGDKDIAFLTSSLVLGSQSGDVLNRGGTVEDSLNQARLSGICNKKDISLSLGTKNESEFLELLARNYKIGKGKKRNQSPIDSAGIQIPSSKIQNFSPESADFEVMIPDTITFEQWGVGRIKKETGKKEQKKRFYSQDQHEAATKLCHELNNIKISSPGINTLLKLIDGTRTNFIREILAGLCIEKKDLSYLPHAITEDFWQKKYQTPPDNKLRIKLLSMSINKELGTKKKPVAIEFCNETVTSSSHEGKYNENGKWICQNNGQHAAVIVGSKKSIFGSCSYLIRDSYCSQYSKRASMSGRSGIITKTDICKNGQFWIPAEQLLKNTRAIVHF
jgi:hypothetical protein